MDLCIETCFFLWSAQQGEEGILTSIVEAFFKNVVVVVVVVMSHNAESRTDRIKGKNYLLFSLVVVLVTTQSTLFAR